MGDAKAAVTAAAPPPPAAEERPPTVAPPSWTLERIALREANLSPAATASKAGLKSDVKKAGIFARKLRSFTADSLSSIASDLESINLNMFISETAQNAAFCIAEGKLKGADVVAFVRALSLVHQKYERFTAELTAQLSSVAVPMDDIVGDMKNKLDLLSPPVDTTRARSVLRCLCELWLVGIVPEVQGWLLKHVLFLMVQTLDAAATNHPTMASVQMLHSVLRLVGPELLQGACDPIGGGDDASVVRLAAAAKQPKYATDKETAVARKLITALVTRSADFCRKLRRTVEEQYKKVCEATELRGEEGNADALAKFATVHDRVNTMITWTDDVITALRQTDTIGLPDLQRVSSTVDPRIIITSRLKEYFTVLDAEHINYYDSDEQQMFYEQPPPIDHLIPTDQAVLSKRLSEDEAEERTTLDYTAIDALIAKLPQCAATRYADAFIEEFLVEATRYYREMGTGGVDQARAFFTNCRVRLNNELRYARTNAIEMLPFYSRIVAALSKHFPDVAETLVSKVTGDLIATVRGKVQGVRGKKRRAGRYIAELTKFRVCPPRDVLRMLQVLTEELDAENASVWAAVVESVGSFLMRGTATKRALEEAIEAFHKKRNATTNIPTSVDEEVKMALDVVRQALKPRGEYRPVAPVPLTPAERYLRYLLFRKLDRKNVEDVIELVLHLPWNDPEQRKGFITILRGVHDAAWHNVHLIAAVIAGVSLYHSWIGPTIADCVIEDMRLDLEYPEHRTQQKRLQDVKFLAELFNSRIISAAIVLYIMGQMVLYFPRPSGPRDYSRLRSFCLLTTCVSRYLLPSVRRSQSANRTISNHRGFVMCLAHFFRYMHTRAKPVPHDIDFRIDEMIRVVQQRMQKIGEQPAVVPVNVAQADAQVDQYGMCADYCTDEALKKSYISFFLASAAPVPSLPPALATALESRFKGCAAPEGYIFAVVGGGGGRSAFARLRTETGFEGSDGPLSQPTDAAGDGVSPNGSEGDDEDEDDDDEEEEDDEDEEEGPQENEQPAADAEEKPSVVEESDAAEYRRSAPLPEGGVFTTGGRGWLTGSNKRSNSGLSEEQLAEQAEFDAVMKSFVKEAISEATVKRANGLQSIERAIEQRLSAGNISTLVKDVKSASKPTDAGATRIAVLRRGTNDKAEAKAIVIPPSSFANQVASVQAQYAKEAAEARERTLAINRVIEGSSASSSSPSQRSRR